MAKKSCKEYNLGVDLNQASAWHGLEINGKKKLVMSISFRCHSSKGLWVAARLPLVASFLYVAACLAKKERRSWRVMNTLKSIGGTLLGIAIFVGIIAATVLFFTFGAKAAFTISPFVNWLAGLLFIINFITLLFALIPKARGVVGLIIYISSYVYGLSAWIYGLAVTLAFWGWVAVIIGIFLGGIGVVPIGMLTSVFNGRWDIFWTLLFTVILTYSARIIGFALVNSTDNSTNDNKDIIDIEPENNKRTWGDLE